MSIWIYLSSLLLSSLMPLLYFLTNNNFSFYPFSMASSFPFFFSLGSYHHGVVFDRCSIQDLQVSLGFTHIFSPSFASIYQEAFLANLPFYDLLQVRNLEKMMLLTCPRLLFQNLNNFVQFLLASCLKICDPVRLVWNESTLPSR